MNQQRSQVRVAALADSLQARLTARGVLTRNQAEPCRQMSAILEFFGVSHGSDHRRRGNRPHAIDCLNLLTQRRIRRNAPSIDWYINAFFHDTNVLRQLDQNSAEGTSYIDLALGQRGRCSMFECYRFLRNEYASLPVPLPWFG